MALKYGLLGAFLSLLFLANSPTTAEVLVLDVHSDEMNEWLDISCMYVTDPADFWVFGCPAGFGSGEDPFPQEKGFWSPCVLQQCEIHYFGGARTPQPKSITFNHYFRGSGGSSEQPKVTITSKYGPLDKEYDNPVAANVSLGDGRTGWSDTTFDMVNQSPRALILNFTFVISNPGDVFILDKIIMDLGEEGTFPPPSTTTVQPIIDELITLDKETDYFSLWETDCVYVDDPYYLWAYGCPANSPVDSVDNAGYGFWSPCNQPKCRIQFMADPMLLLPPPSSITVEGFVEGDARIEVVLQPNPLDYFCRSCTTIGVITTPSDNQTVVGATFALDWIVSKSYRLNFNLVNEGVGGAIIGSSFIENIQIKIRSRSAPTTTTSTTTEDPWGTGAPPVSTEDGGNAGGNVIRVGWVTSGLLIATSVFAIMVNSK